MQIYRDTVLMVTLSWGLSANGHEFSFCGYENDSKQYCGDSCITMWMNYNHGNVYLKWVNFIVCELYPIKPLYIFCFYC